MNEPRPRRAPRERTVYWLLAGALAVYVAVCTGQRQNHWTSDAWEHHRALLALTGDLWRPGNPTFATDDPSIRYSPYTIGLALAARATGADPYDLLSVAAALSTLLLAVGLRWLLSVYGEASAGTAILAVMVALYGVAPGYANSYALSDLPWHQVNPSAPGFALSMMMWAMLRRLATAGPAASALGALALAVLGAWTLLSHAMTGGAAFLVMPAIALTAPRGTRVRLLVITVASGAIAGVLCALWPWYDFLLAASGRGRDADWYNPVILVRMLTAWCAPAILLSLAALPMRRRELVRMAFAAGGVLFALAAASLVTRSAVTARLPLVAVFFAHVLVGLFVHEAAPAWWPGWRARARALFSEDRGVSGRPMVEVIGASLLLYGLLPQVWTIVREPHLARAWIAPLLGREDKQRPLKARFDLLLAPVGPRDVVLSDIVTSWPVPSSGGRIVAAEHAEYFAPDQPRRTADVGAFFGRATDAERAVVLDRYGVRWLLLNRERLGDEMTDRLLVSEAVVGADGDLVLMDARTWREHRAPLAARPP